MANVHALAAVPVTSSLLPLAEARHAGAMMLFGEKYPDIVRMVTIQGVSRELCGGTHVTNTGQIGIVRIIGEESVSAGTRRITAVTGQRALSRFRHAEHALVESARALKVPVGELPQRLETLLKELRDLKKNRVQVSGGASVDDLLAAATDIDGTRVVVADASGSDAAALRQLIDQLRRKGSPIAVMLGSIEGDKVTLVAGISRELEARGLSAGHWIKDSATIVGGKGGGRPDLAQAGGKGIGKLPEALAAAKKSIEQLLRA